MSLEPGTRLGPYEILAAIGAGGMGEVYKAKDTRLDRIVAIKVLLEHLADSPERKQRFEREAKAISQLNHPHICTLHDIGEQDGIHYLVMEYIEGETLADALKKGALPLDKALEYAMQIADALDKAHRAGIVHRDLKPGNVMLTKSGVKLLDFGLARLTTGDSVSDSSDAPTLQKGLTREHAIVGTLQYMAPEQLQGKTADSRADIFALGTVLYEMVTGDKAFQGSSQADLIASILEHEPKPVTPSALARIVSACLAKDPDERWQSVSDVKRQLGWVGDEDVREPAPPRRNAILPWGVVTLVAVLAAIVLSWRAGSRTQEPPVRLSISLPEGFELEELPEEFSPPIALSPDGTTLALVGEWNGTSQLYVRDLNGFDIRPVPDTERATSPFFSPDSEWIGFHADGKLQKVPRAGGAVVTICEAPLYKGNGIDWGPDGTIVFVWTTFSGLYSVPDSGGTPEPITTPDASLGERGHSSPQILPESAGILFDLSGEEQGVAVLSLETGARRTILLSGGGDGARYLPTGHVVYVEDPGFTPVATLQAVPFDSERLEATGAPTPVIDELDYTPRSGRASFTIARTGHLAYVPARRDARWLAWVDRQGKSQRITEQAAPYQFPHLSPDGRRVVFQLDDVWILDLERGTRTRQTVDGFPNNPLWTPDGTELIYTWNRGPWNLFRKTVDAGGDAQLLFENERSQFPMSLTPDGEVLVFHEKHPETGGDIWLLNKEGDPEPFLVSRFDEGHAKLSPDARHIAYVSNESGRDEVYVQPFPTPGRKVTISTDGGTGPLWSRNGRELFYRNGDAVIAVDVETSGEFRPGPPHTLFEGRYASEIFHNYDISPDGQKFLMVESATEPATEVRIILNWFDELERLVPTP